MSDTKIAADSGDFRLLDRKVADALLAMPERDRFIRGMVSWLGFSQVAVPYHRAARLAGKTKYPFMKNRKGSRMRCTEEKNNTNSKSQRPHRGHER